MTGVKIQVIADTKEVTRMVSRLIRRMENPTAYVANVIRYVKAVTNLMFRKRPDNAPVRGESWPKLSESTLKRKISLGQPRRPLIATSTMFESIKVLYKSKFGFIFGTKLVSKDGFPYPAVHNVGGSIPGRPPRRTWLFLTKRDYAQLLQMAIAYLEDRKVDVRGASD